MFITNSQNQIVNYNFSTQNMMEDAKFTKVTLEEFNQKRQENITNN